MSKEILIMNTEMNVLTECAICGTPLSGINLYERGGLYYCVSDFQRTSPEELAENARLTLERNFFSKLYNVR